MALAEALAAGGTRPGGPVGLAVAPAGAALAVGDRSWWLGDGWVREVTRLEQLLSPRWVWWRAATTAPGLIRAGVRPRRCWDLAAVHRLLHGGHRDDPAAVWAAAHERPAPTVLAAGAVRDPAAAPTLLDPVGFDLEAAAVTAAGDLDPGWASEDWSAVPAAAQPSRAQRWAALALEVQARQAVALRAHGDPRLTPGEPPLPELTAWSESAASLIAVELEHDGLPVDLAEAHRLLAALVGPRPADAADAAAQRAARDQLVLRHLPADASCDLRNPAQVRAMLHRLGFDVPDTRSWRLDPFRAAHPAVAALLAWRKTERLATTYGYGWLDRHVGGDGRLRGQWDASDGGAGRMTASAGLHNLPAELRAAVAAEPGHVLVRADLGQIEPRVLAAISHDPALVAATRDEDLYAPVATVLGCDRPTAKVAMLAAMYGQTSGAAAAVLRRMDAAYPEAMRCLRAAEEAGRSGGDVRTYGGRLVRGRAPGDAAVGRYLRNAVVQGAAAELFKAWAATVRAALPPVGGQLVLCLHDELLLHVPEDRAAQAIDLVRDALRETSSRCYAGLPVRLVADAVAVRRWSEAKG